MLNPDAQAAWRLLSFNWIVLGSMALALGLGLALTDFSIAPLSAVPPLAIAAVYTAAGYYNAFRPHRRAPFVVFILASTGQVLLIPVLMTPLTYVAASANLPMQDVALAAVDRALGLDWKAYFNFIYGHHALLVVTVLAYSMIGWPVFGVPIALGWTGRYRRLQEFTLAFAIALIVTTTISVLVPAMGTYDLFNVHPDPNIFTPGAYVDYLEIMPRVRDGTLRALTLSNLTGIVTFPSFHSAAAILYLWALWPVRWLGPVAAVVNVAMILATPIGGGHYFIDLLAGIAVAMTAIVAARVATTSLLRPATQPNARAASAPVPVAPLGG
jgi:hypothetical protein